MRQNGGQARASNGQTVRRRRKMQRVTMTEVARLAAVSPSTVSLYLRKPEAVSRAAGARIGEAIERVGRSAGQLEQRHRHGRGRRRGRRSDRRTAGETGKPQGQRQDPHRAAEPSGRRRPPGSAGTA